MFESIKPSNKGLLESNHRDTLEVLFTVSISSRLISSFHGSTVHVTIVVSVGITGGSPVISFVGI